MSAFFVTGVEVRPISRPPPRPGRTHGFGAWIRYGDLPVTADQVEFAAAHYRVAVLQPWETRAARMAAVWERDYQDRWIAEVRDELGDSPWDGVMADNDVSHAAGRRLAAVVRLLGSAPLVGPHHQPVTATPQASTTPSTTVGRT